MINEVGDASLRRVLGEPQDRRLSGTGDMLHHFVGKRAAGIALGAALDLDQNGTLGLNIGDGLGDNRSGAVAFDDGRRLIAAYKRQKADQKTAPAEKLLSECAHEFLKRFDGFGSLYPATAGVQSCRQLGQTKALPCG